MDEALADAGEWTQGAILSVGDTISAEEALEIFGSSMEQLWGIAEDLRSEAITGETAQELDRMAGRLESEGKSELLHAEEIRRYRRLKFGDQKPE